MENTKPKTQENPKIDLTKMMSISMDLTKRAKKEIDEAKDTDSQLKAIYSAGIAEGYNEALSFIVEKLKDD